MYYKMAVYCNNLELAKTIWALENLNHAVVRVSNGTTVDNPDTYMLDLAVTLLFNPMNQTVTLNVIKSRFGNLWVSGEYSLATALEHIENMIDEVEGFVKEKQ